jgi:hypothetical protein
MKNITPVLIHRPANLISKGIRLVTGSYWNHAGFKVQVEGIMMFVEAVEGSVRIWTWENAKSYYDDSNCEYKYLPDCVMERSYVSKLGASYEFMRFLRDPAYLLSYKLFGECWVTDTLSNLDDPTKFVCFELLAYCMGKQRPWRATGKTFDNKLN